MVGLRCSWAGAGHLSRPRRFADGHGLSVFGEWLGLRDVFVLIVSFFKHRNDRLRVVMAMTVM